MSTDLNVHQRVAIGVTSGLLILTTFVVYLRLYIRCILLKAGSAGYDDLTVFIAWIMAVSASIATYFEIHFGLGRHIEELSFSQVYRFELSLFVVIHFYNVGINTAKVSFLSQYHRLFPDRVIRRICFGFAMFCFVWMFVQAMLYSFSCVPITGLVPGMATVCIPTLPVWTAISSINVFTDLLIFCIPLKPLWGMPLLKRQRYLLIGIFCVGFLICVISIIRIPTLRHGASSPDPTFTNVTTALWSLAELDTAILCTSLPILRPLVARFIQGVAPADVPAGRLRVGRERPMEEQRRGVGKLPGESLLYNSGLTGSTLRSVGQSFLKSLSSSNRDRDRDAEARPAVPIVHTIEVDYPKRSSEKPVVDSPVDGYRNEPRKQLVARPPLMAYSYSRDPVHHPRHIPASPASPWDSLHKPPYTPLTPSTPQYSGNDTKGLPSPLTPRPQSSDSLLKPVTRPSSGDSFVGTLPLVTPDSTHNNSRHQTLSMQTPRIDSFTLPALISTATADPSVSSSPVPPPSVSRALSPSPGSPTQVCSACASLRRAHQPPSLPSPRSNNDNDNNNNNDNDNDDMLPPVAFYAETDADGQPQEAIALRARSSVRKQNSWEKRNRVWVTRSTQTVVTWEPCVEPFSSGASEAVVVGEEGEGEGREEQEGGVEQGQMGQVVRRRVEMMEGEDTRSQRGQLMGGRTEEVQMGGRGTADREQRAAGVEAVRARARMVEVSQRGPILRARVRDRDRDREREREREQHYCQEHDDMCDGSDVGETLPPLLSEIEGNADSQVPSRSNSDRRAVGTSWLRLSLS